MIKRPSRSSQGFGTYGAGLLTSGVAKAKEVTAQVKSTNAAATQQAQAKQAATTKALDAGAKVNPITISAP